jgi:hypothetical protein
LELVAVADAQQQQQGATLPLTAATNTRSSSGGGGGGGSKGVEAEWVCSLGPTGRGFRGELELEIDVEGFGTVAVPLQAKVYRFGDSSVRHGVPLRAVDFALIKHGITGVNRILETKVCVCGKNCLVVVGKGVWALCQQQKQDLG